MMVQAGTLVQKREDAGMILEHHWPESQKLIGLLWASIAHTFEHIHKHTHTHNRKRDREITSHTEVLLILK